MEIISTSNSEERQPYVPASVKVIDITARGVLCQSTTDTNPEETVF